MKKSNVFSVLMPVYLGDNADIFKKSITSIFNNSVLPKYLYLIIDGPLTIELNKIIKESKVEYASKLKIFRFKKNMGITKALNYGLEKITEEVIIRSDADDINNFEKFSLLLESINQGYDIVGSYITEFLDGKKMLVRYVPGKEKAIRKVIKYRNPFNHMSVAFRRSKIINLGGYPELRFFEDYGLWARAIKFNFKVKNINKSLVNVTVNNNFYKRRGGFLYLRYIYNFQKYMLKIGVINKKIFILNLMIRFFVATLFNPLRLFFYNTFLRS